MSSYNSIINQVTITTNGSGIHRDEASSQVVLFWNISGSVTGSSPTIQFTLQEVDPNDEITPNGQSISSPVLNTTGVGNISLNLVNSPTLLISWVVGGSSPSFSNVSLSTVAKISSNQIATVSAPQIQTKYDISDTVIYIGTAASGSVTSDAVWTIKKLTFDGSGNPIEVLWSNNTAIWDNRATSVVYS